MGSRFQVLFGEDAATADFYTMLDTLEVEENADLPGAFEMTLPITTHGAKGSEDLTTVGDDIFAPYSRIAVVVSVDGKPDACIFDGYVLAHRVHLDKGITGSSVRVWGQDVSCLMNLEEITQEWQDSDGAIADEIFQRCSPVKISPSQDNSDATTQHPDSNHTIMQRGTDAQFLRERARKLGRLFRVCCADRAGQNTGYFIKPKLEGSVAATLVLNPATSASIDTPDPATSANIDTLDITWDVARPTEVRAKALLRDKDPVDGGTTDSGLRSLDGRTLADLVGQHAMKVMLAANVDSAAELTDRARSVLREAAWFVKCEGEADLARLGQVLRVATLVQVNGAGKIHSGTYFVWSVRHTITAHAHRMKFVLMRNALGTP